MNDLKHYGLPKEESPDVIKVIGWMAVFAVTFFILFCEVIF